MPLCTDNNRQYSTDFALTLGLRLHSLYAYRKQVADSTLSPLFINATSPDGYAVFEGSLAN